MNIKIKIFLKEKGNLLANATLSIKTADFDFITIKNFQIWKSRLFNARLEDNINILPTNVYRFGRAFGLVFFENQDRWFEIEKNIYDAYIEAKGGIVDPDEVDKALSGE